MKKTRFNIVALIMSTVIAACLLMPIKSYSQGDGTDGFFSKDSEDYVNRSEGTAEVTGGITNDNFGAPLGSGLLVMTAAGAGYVLMKKRKRTMMMIIVAVFMIGMTQCKKRPEMKSVSDRVNIRLTVNGNSKIDVNPINGAVTFDNGDEIVVVNGGRYLGKIYYDEDVFIGDIIEPSPDDYLHFYNFGNVEIAGLEEGVSDGCSINISDQINGLPVISYGHSSEQYSVGTVTYEAQLQNKCALVKFNVSTMSAFAATCIKGMNNKVDVDFTDASFTYSMENDGKIALASGSGERWAILLPQDEVAAGVEGSAFSGRYTGTRGCVPEIHADDLVDTGIEVVMNTLTQPEGALNGVFTVNSEGKQVVFSKSNLAFVKNTRVWMFRNDQFSTIERDGYPVGENCYYLDTLTLYQWGQTDYNHGAVNYKPDDTDRGQKNFYAYGGIEYNLYDRTGKADWGYVIISNGGSINKQWRTPTADEWQYLFAERNDTIIRYGRAIINNTYNGVVLLPDNWEQPEGTSFNGGDTVACTDNKYSLSQWKKMEDAGAVFFPYAGYRTGTHSIGTNRYGFLWSSTAKDKYNVYGVKLADDEIVFKHSRQRNAGISVRLVCE
jgi:hypothetical protein